MGLSLQQISDRIEVEDLLERYTSCIDAKDWDKLDTVFAADAILDYSSSGGPPAGPYPEIKAWLQRALAIFPMTQHMIGKSRITIDGDTAHCRSIFYNPMGMPTDADGNFTADIAGSRRPAHVHRGRFLQRHVPAHRRRLAHRQEGRGAVVPDRRLAPGFDVPT